MNDATFQSETFHDWVISISQNDIDGEKPLAWTSESFHVEISRRSMDIRILSDLRAWHDECEAILQNLASFDEELKEAPTAIARLGIHAIQANCLQRIYRLLYEGYHARVGLLLDVQKRTMTPPHKS